MSKYSEHYAIEDKQSGNAVDVLLEILDVIFIPFFVMCLVGTYIGVLDHVINFAMYFVVPTGAYIVLRFFSLRIKGN